MTSAAPPSPRPRARDLGVVIGVLPTGPTNGIVDVPGVRVGHVDRVARRAVRRAYRCHRDRSRRARRALRRLRSRPAPRCSTAPASSRTRSRSPSGACSRRRSCSRARWRSAARTTGSCRRCSPRIRVSVASDVDHSRRSASATTASSTTRGRLSVTAQDTRRRAVAASTAAVVEGAVGAGSGMTCLGYKGGIGTSSRVVLDGLHDRRARAHQLRRRPSSSSSTACRSVACSRCPTTTRTPRRGTPGEGSCIVVIATDAPLSHAQCERVARRAGLGLARTGSIARHWSGEIFCAFSTTHRGAARRRARRWSTRSEVATNRAQRDVRGDRRGDRGGGAQQPVRRRHRRRRRRPPRSACGAPARPRSQTLLPRARPALPDA